MSRRGYIKCAPGQAEQRRFSAPTDQFKSPVDPLVARIEHDCYLRYWSYLAFSSLTSPLRLRYPYPKGALFDDLVVADCRQ